MRLFAFSNGSEKAVSNLLTNAKIIDRFDGIISVEKMETFKPNPLVYAYFNKESKSSKQDSWLISSNPFDVIGAISYGMRSAWLQRSPDSIFDPWGIEPTTIINKLTDLSLKLEMNE
jgi:2-haloacid dehalogenase